MLAPDFILLVVLTHALSLLHSIDGLTHSIDGIMYTFFLEDLKTREALLLLRQDLTLHFEDSNSIYFAYTYFFHEQLRSATCLELADRSLVNAIFEAGWFIYITAKTTLLAANKFDVLEGIYLLLSLMLTMDGWARSFELPQNQSKRSPASPLADAQTRLAGVTEICNTKLINWREFHLNVFQPWAAEHLPSHLRPFARRLSTVSANLLEQPDVPALPVTQLKDKQTLYEQIGEIRFHAASLIESKAHTTLLEFDDATLTQSTPLDLLYPENGTSGAASSCMDGMFQIQSILHNVRWVHAYSASNPKRAPVARSVSSSQSSPRSASPAASSPAPQIIYMDDVISVDRLKEIFVMVEDWSLQIKTLTPLPENALRLLNDLFFRTLLDILLEDSERAGDMAIDTQPALSPLADKDYFLATLYAAVFEVAIFCFGQSDAGHYTFPFILGVTKVQPMDLCKVLTALARLLTPAAPSANAMPVPISAAQSAPKPISMFIGHLEEKILCDHLWRADSSIYSVYSDHMKSYFQYVLSYAGPPHQPRMTIQSALTSPGMVEKFNSVYRDSSTGSATNWDSHNLIFKILRIGCIRIRNICGQIPFMAANQVVIQQAEHAFAFLVTQRASIFRGRHLDTIALCTIYAIWLLTTGNSPLMGNQLMQAILSRYSSFPACNDAAVHLIPISPEDEDETLQELPLGSSRSPGSPSSRGSNATVAFSAVPNTNGAIRPLTALRFVPILDFYQEIYLPVLSPVLVRFQQPSHRSGLNHSPSSRSAGGGRDIPLASPMTRHPRQFNQPGAMDRFVSIRKRIDFSPFVDPANASAPATPLPLVFPSAPAVTPPRAPRAPSTRQSASKPKPARAALLPMVNTPPRTRPPPIKDEEEEAIERGPIVPQAARPPRKRKSYPPKQPTTVNGYKRPKYE